MKPQLKTILKHLNAVGSITNREAIVEYNIMSLPRRINDLEQDYGVQFKRERKKNPATLQPYVRYHVLTEDIVDMYVAANNKETS